MKPSPPFSFLFVLSIGLVSLVCSHAMAAARPTHDSPGTSASSDFVNMSLEDLLTDHTVTTSGKESLKMSEVPDSIWVLSSEDIRRSGATTIPELLRLVPGMEVIELSPAHYEVSARIPESGLANKLLVLIDGRPTYVNLYRTEFWTSLPVTIEEIERIEVLYGPGSTYYGTGAFTGIINIITRLPTSKSGNARLEIGPQLGSNTRWDQGYAGATYGDRWGSFGLRGSASFNRTPPWNDGTYLGIAGSQKFATTQNGGGDVLVTWHPRDNVDATLNVGAASSSGDSLITLRAPVSITASFADIRLEWRDLLVSGDNLSVRGFDRRNDGTLAVVFAEGIPETNISVTENSAVLSANYRLPIVRRLTATVGVEGEQQNFSTKDISNAATGITYLSAFAQARWRPFDQLALTGGLRTEGQFAPDRARHQLVPKASAVYSLAEGHILRLSVGRAFQYPSLLQSFGNVTTFGGAVNIIGPNPGLTETSSTTYQLGYEYRASKVLTLKADAYYLAVQNDIVSANDPHFLALIIFANVPGTQTYYGGEVGATLAPWTTIAIRASYALQLARQGSYQGIPAGPAHRATLSVRANPVRGLNVDLNGYFLSMYQGVGQESTTTTFVNPTVLVNLRIAYEITRQIQAVVTGYNLLDIRWGSRFRRPFSDAENYQPESDILGRRVMVGVEAQL
jgi:outer membrane receptor for ferrienterochelin and colicin